MLFPTSFIMRQILKYVLPNEFFHQTCRMKGQRNRLSPIPFQMIHQKLLKSILECSSRGSHSAVTSETQLDQASKPDGAYPANQ